jgi:hypothetical protein
MSIPQQFLTRSRQAPLSLRIVMCDAPADEESRYAPGSCSLAEALDDLGVNASRIQAIDIRGSKVG